MAEVIVISPDALRAEMNNFFTDKVVPLISSLAPQAKPPEELVTRKGVKELFDISLPTVDEWTKQGIITGYRIGAHIRYKRSELMQALTKIQAVDQTGRR